MLMSTIEILHPTEFFRAEVAVVSCKATYVTLQQTCVNNTATKMSS